MNGKNLNGVLNIYKEPGYTSHDVVAILRKILGTKKIGHAGTLDPNVSGVLPICVGKATKISSYLMEMGKTYCGEITFGIETDTLDIWGEITNKNDIVPSEESFISELQKIANKTIEQIPPMYSAIKINGKKLYELAREGKEIKRKARKVNIYDTKFIYNDQNRYTFEISCSKGTYIRTIINDLGKKTNSLATMSYLIRTSSGGLDIRKSITLKQLEKMIENEIPFIIPIDKALSHFPVFNVEDDKFELIKNGAKITVYNKNIDNIKYRVYCKGYFIGIGKIIEENNKHIIKMLNVFI